MFQEFSGSSLASSIQKDPDTVLAEKCRRDFFFFVQEFWDIIIHEPPVWNWHIKYLCEELEEMAWQVIARLPKLYDLIVNIPPGTTKSTICVQMFPAWVWIARLPYDEFEDIYEAKRKRLGKKRKIEILGSDIRFITGSYAQDLSLDHAEYARDVIRSDKYKAFFPEIQLRADKDVKSHYKNTKGGSRFSTSVGARVTGVHGHFIIIDDPLNPNQAVSDTDRLAANQWADHTLSTRKVDKAVTPLILIMQRLHQDDLTGHLLSKQKKTTRHICLPGETTYEVKPKHLAKRYVDGLLDPVRLDQDVLDEMMIDLGSYGYAGQVGQDPRPREGGMFAKDWFEVVDAIPAGGNIVGPVRGWDLAATKEKEKGKKRKPAFTAGVKMWRVNGIYYIEDVKRFRASAHQVRVRMKNTASQDGNETMIDFPQDPGQAGKAQAQDLAKYLDGYNVRYSPESGDKVLRADPFSAQCEAGNVKILRGPWNTDWLEEVGFFPNGFKDQVDSAVRAYNRLKLLEGRNQDDVGGPAGIGQSSVPDPEQ